jgi:hypothetical protein
MRLSLPLLMAALGVWASTASADDDDVPPGMTPPVVELPPPRGFEFGLRTGVTVVLGDVGNPSWMMASVNSSHQWSYYVSNQFPLWLDVGYRLTPQLYAGAYFHYDFALTNQGTICGGEVYGYPLGDLTCSGSDVVFGVEAQYHLRPTRRVDPWLEAGLGYEVFSFHENLNLAPISFGVNGGLAHLGSGVDFKVGPALAIAPFAMLGLGMFTSCSFNLDNTNSCSLPNPGLHELLTFGVRGDYVLGW